MAIFQTSFDKTIKSEGGYANNPNDAGKETYKGISRVFNPNWSGWPIIDSMKHHPGFPANLSSNSDLHSKVFYFYKAEYWNKIQGDSIMYQEVADELFDSSVLHGIKTAVMFLQEALNILNKNQTLYRDIVVDGSLGSVTLSVIQSCVNVDGSPKLLLKMMNFFQVKHILERTEERKQNETFVRGWINNRITV